MWCTISNILLLSQRMRTMYNTQDYISNISLFYLHVQDKGSS